MKIVLTKSDVVGKIYITVSDIGISANAEITRYTNGTIAVNSIRWSEKKHNPAKVQEILEVLEQEFAGIGVTKTAIFQQS